MAAKPTHAFASTLQTFTTDAGVSGQYWSLPKLAKQYPSIKRLPVSIRIVLESVLRNCDGLKVSKHHVEELAHWAPTAERTDEIPFVVTRVVLQDFTGVPLLADLAAMRSVAASLGKSPKTIEPLVPVDLVVDHSVMVDYYGTPKALDLNMQLEFKRNHERYQFMKWGMQAFDTFRVVPPGFGIVHQVNLEYFARGVYKSPQDKSDTPVYYPDSLVGTDSHTTMINGVGVVGWGVGGIEAEAAMLGQPVYMLTPDVVGFELTGKLREGVTATDLVLFVTAILRAEKVVGKFVEFFGPGAASIAVPDRATIGNMAPEYGATMGFFPVDDMTIAYFKSTGRTATEIALFEAYYKAQGLFGMPKPGDIDYTKVVRLDLGTVSPSLAGPKRPQDRIDLGRMSTVFAELYSKPNEANGFNLPANTLSLRHKVQGTDVSIGNGDVLIAAITSCTNTSNPSVMLAAGLLAKKAVEAGLKVQPHVKTSLAPGSRIVTDYLQKAGLLPYLEKLGFYLAGYGCTTCIGNAGDLTPEINATITQNKLVSAAVLSGNRNFEARIHPNLKANFLASPPLVVAYAIAGNVMVDLMTQPVGKGKHGKDVFLGDIWPSMAEIDENLRLATDAKAFRANYEKIKSDPGALWSSIQGVTGQVYDWPVSTYIAEPPFFDNFKAKPMASDAGFTGARVMALFGDSITTDHISPAGSIAEKSPAGQWLLAHGVSKADFNSYGSRRGNHDVMVRGTFANVRIKNLMLPADANGSREEGGLTLYYPPRGSSKPEKMPIFDAAQKYMGAKVPTVVFGGEEYGTGSSRDWAAKGTQLLGIKAVVARSFERIHRANLVGMGVLPLQFRGADSWETLNLQGDEEIDVVIGAALQPQMDVTLVIRRRDGTHQEATVRLRIDTPIEVEYYQHGGILPFVLRQLLAA
ncbi:aconitate hydratase AcnA [Rhodoferax sp.]|uniref:aconitate hydratase AcnA n=1 Tax=Rhodoferax sp. TaxID=50421 RepID=UPI00374D0C4C